MKNFDSPFIKPRREYAARNDIPGHTIISVPGAMVLEQLFTGHAIPPEQECMATDVFMTLYPAETQRVIDALEWSWNQLSGPAPSIVGSTGTLIGVALPIVKHALIPMIENPLHRNHASVVIASWMREAVLPLHPRATLLSALQKLWDVAPAILDFAEQKRRRGDFKVDWSNLDEHAWWAVYGEYRVKFNQDLDEEIRIYADHLGCNSAVALLLAAMQAWRWRVQQGT